MKTGFIRFVLMAVAGSASAAAARAQYAPPTGPFVPYQTPGNYPRATTAPQTQPVSPYLNLFRGGIPAVNYYSGVRPALANYGPANTAPAPGPRAIQPMFLPTTPPGGLRDPVPAGFEYTSTPKETTLSPAGHPVQFANTGGYFPGLAAPRPGGFTRPPSTPTKKP